MQDPDKPHAAEAGGLTPAKGLMVLGLVVLVVGAFLALGHTLGIADVWVAFLFLMYWAGIEHMNFQRLPHCMMGAFLGLAVAYALVALPLSMGLLGGILWLVGLLALIYCQVMGWFPLAVNNATMLFLTVGTIPMIQSGGDFPKLFVALAVGMVFFPGLAWAGSLVARRSAARKVGAQG